MRVADPLWRVDFSKLRSQGPHEILVQSNTGKEVGNVGRAWFHPEFIFTPDVFAQALQSVWILDECHALTAHRQALWSSFGIRVCTWFKAEGFSVFLPFLFPWSLGRDASPLTVWLHLRGCGGVWLCLFCGNSHLFSMTHRPAKKPVDLAFFLLRCWNFQ